MTKTHTPGPWKSEWTSEQVGHDADRGDWSFFANTEHGRTYLGTWKSAQTSPEQRAFAPANARLIASAPDLLAVCKALEMRISAMRAADQGGVDKMPVPLFLAAARAAIQKAEGKE